MREGKGSWLCGVGMKGLRAGSEGQKPNGQPVTALPLMEMKDTGKSSSVYERKKGHLKYK